MLKKFSAPLAPDFIMTDEWCLSIEPFSRTPPPPKFWGALLTPPLPPEVKTRHALLCVGSRFEGLGAQGPGRTKGHKKKTVT